MSSYVSVIIPTYNEEANIGQLLQRLTHTAENRQYIGEIIVADAGSDDRTVDIAAQYNADVIRVGCRNRGVQMNAGAAHASGTVYYFLHADVMPPETCIADVYYAVQSGYRAGCFRSRFNTRNRFLLLNSWFTRFQGIIFRGGGQSLFVTCSLFDETGGYDENLRFMEEYELILSIKRKARFYIIPENILVSARAYEANGPFLTQFTYALIFAMYFMGFSQNCLAGIYRKFARRCKKNTHTEYEGVHE